MIRFACVMLVIFGALGCNVKEEPLRDTGYTGTWERGRELRSVLAIVESDGQYLVRKSAYSSEAGGPKLSCDWDGRCEEFVDGEKTAEYTFRVSIDPQSKHLRIECTGTVFRPEPGELHYVDELMLKDDGLRIRARTLERMGREYDRAHPKRDYAKTSNTVTDPPAGWSAEPD